MTQETGLLRQCGGMRLACLLVAALAGCGLDAEEQPPVVTIDPPVVDLNVLQLQTFAASVSGIGDAAVDWSVSGGSIVATAATSLEYRAPAEPGAFRVRAISRRDPAGEAFATVRVSVPAGVTIGLAPARAQVPPLGEQDWVASVVGVNMSAVDWSTDGGAFLSQNDAGVRWMAPASPGSYHVVAIARVDPAASAAATVDVVNAGVTAPLVIWIFPADVEMVLNGQASFQLGFSTNEMPGVDVSVSWSATGGSIEVDNDGAVRYSPTSRGRQLVIARSNSYPGVVASASVLVR
ncbi:MAG: hypothetical protein KF788_16205 [Piscinibacter sp.]|nr:hypothetical protein [Piscinibacter sp.]